MSTNIQDFSGDIQIRGTTFIKANSNTNNLAIGTDAGLTVQGEQAIGIGLSAGKVTQGQAAVAVGRQSGVNNQGNYATAVGYLAGQTEQGDNTVAVGNQAGNTSQGSNAIAIGNNAGSQGQNNVTIAIGTEAGQLAQAQRSIAIGEHAGQSVQGSYSIAIGPNAGLEGQNNFAIAIGNNAGCRGQDGTVAIGGSAGREEQGDDAIAIGPNAGSAAQGNNSVAVGRQAGQTDQGNSAVAVGYQAAGTSQGINAIAVGYLAGSSSQLYSAVAIGVAAGQIDQGSESVAVGRYAGKDVQGSFSVAVGSSAGQTTQGCACVAIGILAGQTIQGAEAVAIGDQAGQTSQGVQAIAVGELAGRTCQGVSAVAIGVSSGRSYQGSSATAVGNQAGETNQGEDAVAVGFKAGETNQHDHTIVLNATGAALNSTGTDRLFIKPIRSGTDGSTVLSYDDSTGEIIDSTNLATDATRISAGTGIRFNGVTNESFNGGGGSGTVTEDYHMRFNSGRQLTLTWTDASQYEFRWGGGGSHGVRASIGTDTVFGFTFTGQHRNFIKDVPYQDVINRQLGGLIVSANNNEYVKITGGAEKGSNAITQNEALPILSLSSKTLDKSCFGVISESEDPNTARSGSLGMFRSFYDTEDGDKRVIINSLGEGAIWVVNTNGSLESGDYITTSNVAGYGQKQDSEFLANYTVAKITMDCDFEPTTNPVQIIKKELSNVNYWVNTTYENVTNDQYLHLDEENRRTITETVYTNEYGETFTEQNEQSTYTELTRTVYQQIITEESKTEREGWSTEIRQETNNVLDEHGQIQWEDHPTETEKAYKIRYLDADGGMTDEANHVYKAAYVGCTYHCG
jgi:hypothetical protein